MDYTVETVEPSYMKRGLVDPGYRLRRVDGGESRYYYHKEWDRFLISVTSLIGATTPMGYGLLDWIKRLGSEADIIRDLAAVYGTWLHIQLGGLLITGKYDFKFMRPSLEAAASENGYRLDNTKWYALAKQDILAFAQFMRDHKVKPLAIEICLASKDGYGGALDLVCEMKVNRLQEILLRYEIIHWRCLAHRRQDHV